jgi:alkanesulfonate monooxygenase SsuD/methylene tetrahydromethanopterin reductase-like flavin-dependent oxidoreductase (luciferase family)
MFISYFTEQPYYPLPEEELFSHYPGDHPARKLGDAVLLFSNRFFDATHARQLFEDRMTEYRYAEEVGFDAITLKEHHSVPWCLQARTNIVASFVAANTNRVKIIQQGHLLPIWDNPVQLAEEIAMIDLMSNGRIVPGIFRGPGQDSAIRRGP